MKKIGGLCSREDCDRPFYGKGLCKRHYSQERNAARKEEQAEQNRRYYQENRDRILESKKLYREANKEVARRGARTRRARRKGTAPVRYNEADVLALHGSACYLCGEPINLEAPRRTGLPGWEMGLHIDHVKPLCQGGIDSIDNVRPAHGKCNLRRKRR